MISIGLISVGVGVELWAVIRASRLDRELSLPLIFIGVILFSAGMALRVLESGGLG